MTILTKAESKALEEFINEINLARDFIEELRSDQESTFDGLSEKAQESERGQARREVLDYLESALNELENAVISIEGACNA